MPQPYQPSDSVKKPVVFPLNIAPQQGNWWRWRAQTAHSLPHKTGGRLAISHGHLTPDQRAASSAASPLSLLGRVCVARSIHSSQKNSEGLSTKSIPALWWNIKARRALQITIKVPESTKKPCGEGSPIRRARPDVTCSRLIALLNGRATRKLTSSL